MIYPEDDGKDHIPDLIVDAGGNMNLLIHEGKKAEYLFIKDGNMPDPSSTNNVEFNIVQTIINHQVEDGETDAWKKIINTCMGFYEETIT